MLVPSSSSLAFCILNFSQTSSIVPVSKTVQSLCDSAHRFTIAGLVSVATTVPKYSPNLLATSPWPEPISRYAPPSTTALSSSSSPSPPSSPPRWRCIKLLPTKTRACSRLKTNIFPLPRIAFASVSDLPSFSRKRVHACANLALTSRGRREDLKRNASVSASLESWTNFLRTMDSHSDSSSSSSSSWSFSSSTLVLLLLDEYLETSTP